MQTKPTSDVLFPTPKALILNQLNEYYRNMNVVKSGMHTSRM